MSPCQRVPLSSTPFWMKVLKLEMKLLLLILIYLMAHH